MYIKTDEEEDDDYDDDHAHLKKVVFPKEATCHMSGIVRGHYCRI
jgi:hypothetical protein